jgi:hypothetical protein
MFHPGGQVTFCQNLPKENRDSVGKLPNFPESKKILRKKPGPESKSVLFFGKAHAIMA